MRIRFHGAIDEVTGSCYELVDDAMKLHLLVDCGLVQGELDADTRNRRPFPFEPATLTHVVLTHAHADHSGLVPRLYAEGYKGSVYCTKETAELAKLVQTDSASLGLVPYTKKDVARQQFHEPDAATGFGRKCPIAKDLFVEFYRSGHILGATSVTIRWGPKGDAQKTITFSADVGPNAEDREVLPLIGYRMSPARADYLVVESTYGATVRAPLTAEDRLGLLGDAIERGTKDRQGTIIIPCFALERLPDVLCDLTVLFARQPARFANLPVVLDTSLGHSANRVMAEGLERSIVLKDGMRVRDTWLGRGIYRLLGLDWKDPDARNLVLDAVKEMLLPTYQRKHPRVGTLAHWRRIWVQQNRANNLRNTLSGPAVVLTTGGMCDGGPVQYYLLRLLADPSTTVLFPGYCGSATIGGKLLELKNLDVEQRRRIGGELAMVPGTMRRADVRATIENIPGYSAHADQPGLVDWMWSGAPGAPRVPIARTIFISHGAPEPRRKLGDAIKSRAAEEGHEVNIELPPRDRWFDLDQGRWLDDGLSEVELLRLELMRLRSENASLRSGTVT